MFFGRFLIFTFSTFLVHFDILSAFLRTFLVKMTVLSPFLGPKELSKVVLRNSQMSIELRKTFQAASNTFYAKKNPGKNRQEKSLELAESLHVLVADNRHMGK